MHESIKRDTITEEAFYEICQAVHKHYTFLGKLLIMAFSEVWDIPAKAKDGKVLEDGDRVSRRILVVVCPISLAKGGLEYKGGSIIPREMQWVIRRPEMAFLWPSWEAREDCFDKFTYFVADPANPEHRFMETGLGTDPIMTATEYRQKFEEMILKMEEDQDAGNAYLQEIKDAIELHYRIIQNEVAPNPETVMSVNDLEEILSSIDSCDQALINSYRETFGGKLPKMKWLFSTKDIKEAEKRRNKKKISQLLKKAAKKIKSISPKDELVERLMAEAEKNDRRGV